MSDGFSPELRWCLAALTGQKGPSEAVDPPKLLAMLRHHRLLLRVPAAALTDLPPALADRVKQARRDAAARTMADLAGLFRVIAAFEQHDIPVLCLKGPTLAALFGAPERLRISHDFDLLVSPDQLLPAEDTLHQLGYQPETAERRRSPWHGHSWRHPNQTDVIELHHRLFSPASLLPAERFDPWCHTQPVMVQGRRLTGLTAPASLVYLAIHGAQHVWWRLFWLSDIADALADTRMDWAQALALAQQAGVDRSLLLAVTLAQQLLHAPVPPVLTQEQATIAALAPATQLVRRGLALTPMPERRWVYRLGLAAYIRWHWRLAPTGQAGRDLLAQTLWPAGTTPVAAFRRWVRIAGRTRTGGPPSP